MKTKKYLTIFLTAFTIIIYGTSSMRTPKDIKDLHNISVDTVKVTVTVYNPVPEQCNADYLHTADGSFIDTVKLKNNEIRWIAVSRDLLKHINFGDTLELFSDKNEYINGKYVVHDVMHKRWTNRIDILSHKENNNKIGKVTDVNTSITFCVVRKLNEL